jgi:hypothetical protein
MTVAGDDGPREPSGGRPIEARFVRQGRRSTRMVWVMTVSLGLVALLFLAIWSAKLGPGANQMNRITRADARLFNQPAQTAPRTPAQPPGGAGRAE